MIQDRFYVQGTMADGEPLWWAPGGWVLGTESGYDMPLSEAQFVMRDQRIRNRNLDHEDQIEPVMVPVNMDGIMERIAESVKGNQS